MAVGPQYLLMRCIVAIFTIAISGCSTISHQGVQSVSIAPDDQSFAFSYRNGDESLIAIKKINEGAPTIVHKSGEGKTCERPIFSNNGQKLFFISRNKRDQSDLYVVSTDGSGLTQITHGQEGAGNIQDFSLSEDGDTIYYINSGIYGHSSPIAASRPHNLDFYSIHKNGAGLERLSYSNSYDLHGVSISPSGKDIYSRFAILNLSTPRQFTRFNYYSHFLIFTSQYPLSEFAHNGTVVLSSGKVEKRKPGFSSREEIPYNQHGAVYGYGLYLIDINNETVREIIHLPSALDSPALFHNQERVFLSDMTMFLVVMLGENYGV
jgi:Tol biopolymer transport system component